MQEPSVVQSIRIPRKLWDEIKERAEITDRSFNRVVRRILEAHFEQEKQKVQSKEEVGA